MSRLDWTEIILKILAASNIVVSVLVVPSLIGFGVSLAPFISADSVRISWVLWASSALLLIFPVVLGILVWRKARTIAVWLWRGRSPEAESGTPAWATFAQVKVALFSGLGLYLLLGGIPAFLRAVGRLYQNLDMIRDIPEATLYMLPEYLYIFGIIVQAVMAIVLVVSPQRVIRFLNKMWNLGAEG